MKDLYHSSWDNIKLKRPPLLSVKFMLTKHHLSNHQTNAEVEKPTFVSISMKTGLRKENLQIEKLIIARGKKIPSQFFLNNLVNKVCLKHRSQDI